MSELRITGPVNDPGRSKTDGLLDAWFAFTVSGGTVTLQDDFNIDSITDNGVGDFAAVITTDFSSANYAASILFESATPQNLGIVAGKSATDMPVAGTFTWRCYEWDAASGSSATVTDPDWCSGMFAGTQ